MAPAIPVTGSPTTRHILVLAVGTFGREVLNRVQSCRAEWSFEHLDEARVLDGALDWQGDALLVAAWRESPRVTVALDEAAWARRTPWLPVVMEHPSVRVGPTVVPGQGPCYQCFRGRLAQHDATATLTAALHDAYGADSGLGPAGFSPHHVSVAAGLTLAAAADLTATPPRHVGRVIRYQVLSQQIGVGHVVGRHACPRCGLGRDEVTRSSTALVTMAGAGGVRSNAPAGG